MLTKIANLKELSPPVIALDVVEDPISEACTKVARSWLSACVESHARCKELSENETPTRLIDVGATDGSQRPRLKVMTANSQGTLYVTLSHCWGDPSHITKLIKGNIAELMEEIDEVALSRSFQDAINITRSLNIRYLWIERCASFRILKRTGLQSLPRWLSITEAAKSCFRLYHHLVLATESYIHGPEMYTP
jgi:Heterokaryon incompatibility protein (HET)